MGVMHDSLPGLRHDVFPPHREMHIFGAAERGKRPRGRGELRSAGAEGNIMSERVTIMSEGLKLAGVLHIPKNITAGEKRPAFLVLHGFGGNKEGEQGVWATKTLLEWGYVCLQIDFRGCGESEGTRGRIVPQEEVIDAQNAITFLEDARGGRSQTHRDLRLEPRRRRRHRHRRH